MLKRWNEAHKKFEKEYKGLYSKVGPYLIIDEYLNTVGQCFNFFPSEEQFKLLQENLLHINDSIIDNSPVLDATQKNTYCAQNTLKTETISFQKYICPSDRRKSPLSQ